MKNIWKILLVSATAVSLFAACAPEEKLDLAGYPETTALGFNITDIRTPGPLLELTAVYARPDSLALDGEVTHTYTLRLDSPSSQDMTVTVEPIIVNIPADQVTISVTTATIPAGEVELPVVVTFTGEDFDSFASHKDAQTYELGVRVVDMQGYNLSADLIGTEAKVVINKERYQATLSLADPLGGNTAIFKRSYWDGALDTDEPLTYTFKATLDWPSEEDITLTFDTEGMPGEFLDDITIEPVTIAAGELESEEITWTATTDFLLVNDEAESYTLTLKPTLTSNDAYIGFVDGMDEVVLTVNKGLSAVELVSPIPGTWTAFDRAGWVATKTGTTTYGQPSAVLDGSYASDIDGSDFGIILDMQETKNMVGMSSHYYGWQATGTSTYYPRNVKFSISDDGETWTQVGDLNIPSTGSVAIGTGHTYRFFNTFPTRYVKFEVSGGTTWLSELRVYGEQ